MAEERVIFRVEVVENRRTGEHETKLAPNFDPADTVRDALAVVDLLRQTADAIEGQYTPVRRDPPAD